MYGPFVSPYPTRRVPLLARNVVATSQPLAAQAGLRMLLEGGNAVDAAVAAAIALCVVEPNNNGIGSDAFALIWQAGQLHGLNASGRSPAAWTPERFSGLEQMPVFGWDSVTVPGAVSAWAALSQRFGRLPFVRLFEPAIDYAREGFPVGPMSAYYWRFGERAYREYPDFSAHFLPHGRAPRAGERFVCPETARTLEEIAETGGESFYRGALARRIADCARSAHGALSLEDLSNHAPEWVEPLSQAYRDVRLHEIPPNGQGLAALIALGLLQHHEVSKLPIDSADWIHLQVEAMKIAWVEVERHLADPEAMQHAPRAFLDAGFLARRAEAIDMRRAGAPRSSIAASPDTVYLCTADAEGTMVSFIQSNFLAFGSGIVVPGTGIHLQNRGFGFSLEPGHPNRVGPRKRPFHTIIPGFVTRAGEAVMSFGVMGGHMQAQGHVQMVVRTRDHAQSVQAACDAPRWHLRADGALLLEAGFAAAALAELRARGHRLVLDAPPHLFGGAQLIARADDGYCAASDSRKEGLAVGF